MPAETEPHARTLMAWPPDAAAVHLHARRSWNRRGPCTRRSSARSPTYEPVTLVVGPDDVASATELVGDAADDRRAADRRLVDPRRRSDRRARTRRRPCTRCTSGSTRGATSRTHDADAAVGAAVAAAPRPAGARGADGARGRIDRGRRPGNARHDRALSAQSRTAIPTCSRAEIEARAAARSSASIASSGSPTRSPRTTAPTATSTTSSRSRPAGACSCRVATIPRIRTRAIAADNVAPTRARPAST